MWRIGWRHWFVTFTRKMRDKKASIDFFNFWHNAKEYKILIFKLNILTSTTHLARARPLSDCMGPSRMSNTEGNDIINAQRTAANGAVKRARGLSYYGASEAPADDEEDCCLRSKYWCEIRENSRWKPINLQAHHNIELLVLSDIIKGSSVALDFRIHKTRLESRRRNHLLSLWEGDLRGERIRRSERHQKEKQNETGWKRLKEMNILAFGRKVERRKLHSGAKFVVKL